MPTQPIDAVDSTGAGDAFPAACIVARMDGLSVRKALAVGNAISREVIQHQRARLPLTVGVSALLQRAKQAATSMFEWLRAYSGDAAVTYKVFRTGRKLPIFEIDNRP